MKAYIPWQVYTVMGIYLNFPCQCFVIFFLLFSTEYFIRFPIFFIIPYFQNKSLLFISNDLKNFFRLFPCKSEIINNLQMITDRNNSEAGNCESNDRYNVLTDHWSLKNMYRSIVRRITTGTMFSPIIYNLTIDVSV